MAMITYKTYLMYKSGSTYTKLVDIKSFPDMGGEPDNVETTTLSDGARTYIPGIKDPGGNLTFPANYVNSDYDTIKGLAGTELDLALWFGATVSGTTVTPDGSEGKLEWKGYVDVYVNGAGVNDVIEMSVVTTPTTEIVMATT